MGVNAPYPKFSPLIVTVADPVFGELLTARLDTAGASYENVFLRVPTTAETVTVP